MMSIINTSPPPATSVTLQHLYMDVFRPLFFPASAEFAQPLLDGFVDAHDDLLEVNSLFTHSTRSREIGVEVDGTIRELRRRAAAAAAAPTTQGEGGDHTSLAEVRKLRLRSRLYSVYLTHPRDPNRWITIGGQTASCSAARIDPAQVQRTHGGVGAQYQRGGRGCVEGI